MASEDKLVYFDIKARGEPTRMVYAVAGNPLKDERIPAEQWPSKKEGWFDYSCGSHCNHQKHLT